MGSVYRPKDRNVWWIAYSRGGKRYAESSGSTRKKDAVALLSLRGGDIARGLPVTPSVGKVTFEDAAADLLNDYTTNNKKSADDVARRVRKHLTPFFGGHRMANITTSDVRAYIAKRQAETTVTQGAYNIVLKDGTIQTVPERTRAITKVSNGEVNRELTLLKRMFSLALQAGKLLHRPHIPLLQERNTRTGFFEAEQLTSVVAHLPTEIRPIIKVRGDHRLAHRVGSPPARMATGRFRGRRSAARP